MRLLASALLVMVGCFDPGQPSLRCTADKPLCPDGLVLSHGHMSGGPSGIRDSDA